MNIKIKIPRKVVTAWDRFCDWGNVPVPGLSFRGYPIVRLDFINALGLLITIAWGYYVSGWWGALLYFLSYVLVAMCALWFF
jgi:hypothetical protein